MMTTQTVAVSAKAKPRDNRQRSQDAGFEEEQPNQEQPPPQCTEQLKPLQDLRRSKLQVFLTLSTSKAVTSCEATNVIGVALGVMPLPTPDRKLVRLSLRGVKTASAMDQVS